MGRDTPTFDWLPIAERAAELVATGRLTRQEIAADLGIGRTTLWRWRRHPDFKARVAKILAEYRAEADKLRRERDREQIRLLLIASTGRRQRKPYTRRAT
jgi:transposase-like protein